MGSAFQKEKERKTSPKNEGWVWFPPVRAPVQLPPLPGLFFFVTTYKKCPSCSLFDRNAGGSVNSRRRLAPPRGPGTSRVSAEFGVLELGPTVQREAQPGVRGGKGEKALGTQKGTKLPKPLICAEATPSECPKPRKIQRLVPLEGPSQCWEPPAPSWDSPAGGKATPAAAIPLFLCVFHLFAFFPLFLAVQGVELRCPGSVTMPEGGKFQQLWRKIPCGLGFFFLLSYEPAHGKKEAKPGGFEQLVGPVGSQYPM